MSKNTHATRSRLDEGAADDQATAMSDDGDDTGRYAGADGCAIMDAAARFIARSKADHGGLDADVGVAQIKVGRLPVPHECKSLRDAMLNTKYAAIQYAQLPLKRRNETHKDTDNFLSR
jgi:hypothetical protein